MELVKVTNEVTSDRVMIDGSHTHQSYMVFARKGDILVGIEPLGLSPGKHYGVPGTTQVQLRVRTTKDPQALEKLLAGQKVVQLQQTPGSWEEAWPGVTWVKNNSTYASTIVSGFVPGELSPQDEDTMQQLIDNLSDGKLGAKITAFLVDKFGAENFVVEQCAVAAFLNESFDKPLQKALKKVAYAKAVAAELSSTIGTFGFQMDVANAVIKKLKPLHDTDVEDEAEVAAIEAQQD